MGDRELSTRDLAERSDTSASDAPVETEQETSDQDDIKEPSRSGASPGETEPADEPMTRGRSESDDPGQDVPAERGTDSARAQPTPSPADSAGERGPLLPDDQTERFTTRWEEIQASFVDEPRDSVAQADALVADLMQRLAAGFSAERERLEGQWDSGDDVSTEDLRVALTRYRSFFDRLLSA
jgi:hypothetical protein